MRAEIEYAAFPELLSASFPDIRLQIKAEIAWWSPDQLEVEPLVGDVFVPYLTRILRDREANHDELMVAFELIERMVADPDSRVRDLAVVSILEALEDDPTLMEEARPLMGSETTKRIPTRGWKDEQPRFM